MKPEQPKDTRPAVGESAAVTVEHRSIRIGPLPDPADLARYDEIVAGGAERIMRMAEKQAAHRQDLERAVVSADIAASGARFRLAERGQSFALAIGLATLAVCLAAAFTGHDGAAIALAASSLVGVVAAFLGARLRGVSGMKVDAT